MLAPRSTTKADEDRKSGVAAIVLAILVMVAAFATLTSRDPLVEAPGANHTNISPTAQVVWDG